MSENKQSFMTMNEMAKELKVTKQKVYRFIKKNEIHEAYQEAGAMYYDESTLKALKTVFNDDFKESEANHEALIDVLSDALLKQVEIKDLQLQQKDNQIEELTKLLDQQQQLLLMTSKQKETLEIEFKSLSTKKSRWWDRRK